MKNENSERCLQYLLGELTPQAAEAFEVEFGESAELAEQLLHQADVLAMLGESCGAQTFERQRPPADRRMLIKTVAMLAASLLIGITFWQLTDNQHRADDEELRIARAWANQIAWRAPELPAESLAEPSSDEGFETLVPDDPLQDNQLPSWIMAAVETDSDDSSYSEPESDQGDGIDSEPGITPNPEDAG